MKLILTLVFIILGFSCKSQNKPDNENDTEHHNYLLSISRDEVIKEGDLTTVIYKIPTLKRTYDSDEYVVYYKDKIIFSGNHDCLYLMEVFNENSVLISLSGSDFNMYVAGIAQFERAQIFLLNTITSDVFKLKLDDNVFLHLHKKFLSKHTNERQYAISNIDYQNLELRLVDGKDNLITVDLEKTNSIPIKCK